MACFDSQLCDHVVCSTRDKKAVKAMLEKMDLKLEGTMDICCTSEVEQATHVELCDGTVT